MGKQSFKTDQRGLTTVEYALLGAMIALVAIGGFESLGEQVGARADDAAQVLQADGSGASGAAGDGAPGAGTVPPATAFPQLNDVPQSTPSNIGNNDPSVRPFVQGWSGDP